MIRRRLSRQTITNWGIDATLAIGALLASLSGVYFLFLPVGGYQGGRNAMYDVTILFSRHTWSDLHLWTGLAMILAAMVHIGVHWSWIARMTRTMIRNVIGREHTLSNRSRINVLINATIGASFLVTAVSGVYLLLVPGGSAGRLLGDPMFLFSRTTWDLAHTWAGVVMIIAGLMHFAIHWGWVVKVSRGVAGSLPSVQAPAQSRSDGIA